MRNAAERKDIRKAEKLARQAELARVEFIQLSMDTRNGRAWFKDVLDKCHIFHTTFVAADALSSAYSEGERNIGLQIYNDIVTYCPGQFVLMMQEAAAKEQAYGRTNDSDTSPTDELGGSEDGDRGTEGSINGNDRSDREYNIYADV